MQQNSLVKNLDKYVTPTNMMIAGGGLIAGLIAAGCDLTTLLLLGAAGFIGVKYYEQVKKTAVKRDAELSEV